MDEKPRTDLPGEWFDERGRLHSAFVERGSGNLPRQVVIPDIGQLDVSTPEGVLATSRALDRFGGYDTQEWIERQKKYLARFGITPDDPARWGREMDRLCGPESQRRLLGQARRVQENFSSLASVGGDLDTVTIWVAEGDSNTCEECIAQAGIEMTMRERLQGDILPGASVCLGGDNCRCTLAAVESPEPATGGWLLAASIATKILCGA